LKVKSTLIVYGSLAPGESNHHIISHIDGVWSKAFIKGKIVDNGWLTRNGYPEFQRVHENDAEKLEVLAFISQDLHLHWEHIMNLKVLNHIRDHLFLANWKTDTSSMHSYMNQYNTDFKREARKTLIAYTN